MKGKKFFPRWTFGILAIGGLLASGVYIGVMSMKGITTIHLVKTIGFGTFGLLMFYATFS